MTFPEPEDLDGRCREPPARRGHGPLRYQAQIAEAIPADDANLRAAIISAITLGITVSRHLIKSDEPASADPAPWFSASHPAWWAWAQYAARRAEIASRCTSAQFAPLAVVRLTSPRMVTEWLKTIPPVLTSRQ